MRRVLLTTVALAVAALIGLAALPTDAGAHSGGLSPKDQCHNHKAADERHWHKDGTAERGGPCLTIDGKTRYFGSNALCAVERAAIIVARQAGGSVSGDTAQALVHCVQGLGPPLTAACQGKLEWLVDGNGRFGSSVPIKTTDLNAIADLCLGRPARE